jgi:mycothiol synthase
VLDAAMSVCIVTPASTIHGEASGVSLGVLFRAPPYETLTDMELRAPTAEDRAGFFALLTESEEAEAGRVMSSRAEADAMLAVPGLDLANRARIHTDGNRMTAFVAVHPAAWPGELQAQLILAPDAEAYVSDLLGVIAMWSRSDRPAEGPVTTSLFALPGFIARQALVDDGWQVVHSYTRMQALLDRDRPVALAEDFTIQSSRSTADMRIAHAVLEDAVAGHWKHQRRSFEEFLQDQESREGHNPELWFLAMREGEPAGAAIAREAAENAWIGWLGVHPRHRRHGIANALLHTAFNELRHRGHETVGVDVDTHNETDANAVYERAGMKVILRADQWSKTYD